MSEMVAFYTEAFGGTFREVDAGGFSCWFGSMGGLEIKLVPFRDDVDFEGFPLHQLGFDVEDHHAVIACAVTHGGRAEGEITEREGKLHGAVRDPDGNTIELYSSA
jgi:predicted enzyme related to lactoylglutathione lyase